MTKLLTTLFALTVAFVTVSAQAQTAAPAAPAAPAATPAAKAATPKSLEAKAAMCIGCHAIKGYHATFPEVYRVPMIAGQNAKYIASALTAYKNGDRKHPTMRTIAASLSEQDITDLAAYYESEGKAEQKTLADKPNVEPNAQVSGLMQKAACVSCHGANFSKPIDPSYPKIAGQHPDYLFVALKAYKTEGNPQVGRANGVMGAIAKQFTNAELKELANYVGKLDGELVTKPQSRMR
ncbi:c-type cytochrome [Caenimonas koreensis]|uniref:C-type cytochrome n=1 Tax=Caenimonas koreensis DSM 17982 TaxID=1121255 RepID=A0A844AVB8_9BURK|nr:c-type cytochrome [Caenimonas koreensis]MRD48345.1 c-type cytochrome [Caenimonas koreensis DSM 17982]